MHPITAIFTLLLWMGTAHGRAPMIDAHAHYTAADAQILSPADVVAALDGAGVARMVVTGAPPALAQTLYRHAPGRFIPLLGVYAHERDKAHWLDDDTLPERVEAALQTGAWAGIGEVHLFAADARHPVFEALVRIAAARDLVLMIHGDAEVVARAFELAPRLRVLWAHLGTEPEPPLVDAMLGRYGDRLWIDTSVRDERIAPQGRLLPAWRAVFERHPENFLVAVDTFSVNRWQRYGEVVTEIRRWTRVLPEPLRGNLLYRNAARLFAPFDRAQPGVQPSPPSNPSLDRG